MGVYRYRNFRTLVCPDPTPLTGVDVDATGDIVVAAAEEKFQVNHTPDILLESLLFRSSCGLLRMASFSTFSLVTRETWLPSL